MYRALDNGAWRKTVRVGQGAAPSEICLAGTLYVMHESVRLRVCPCTVRFVACLPIIVTSAFVSGLYNFDSGLFTVRVLCSEMCVTDSNTDTGQRRRWI